MTVIVSDDEYTYRRLQRFLENGLSTQRFIMPAGAANGYPLISDAAGIGTWQSFGTLTVSFKDSLFSIFDDAAPAKIAAFQLDGLTAGTHTYRPPPTAAASTSTLAAIDLAQTFTAAQIMAPTSGIALTLTPPSGTNRCLLTGHTDSAYVGTGNGLWEMTSTLSNTSGILGEAIGLRIAPTINNVFDVGVRALRVDITGSQYSGSLGNLGSLAGLLFRVTSTGTAGANWSGLQGINGTLITGGGDRHALTQCAAFFTTVSAGTTITEARGLDIGQPTSTGTISDDGGTPGGWTAINIRANTGGATNSGTLGAFAIKIGNYTRSSVQNWSLGIGTSASGAPSHHWGPFRFGDATNPTHRLDVAAGTTTIAPIRLTSATAITTPVAGCIEFTTDDYFATITTGATRKAFVLDDGARLTSGRVPFATTNGRLVDDADMTFSVDTLTATKLVAPTSIQVGGGSVVTKLDFGTYTPTLTSVANVAASTSYQCQWVQIGNTVTVSGKADVDPFAIATFTQLGVSLPVASNLGATEDCAGACGGFSTQGEAGAVVGDAANNRAELDWVTADPANHAMFFVFTYEVI